ncbi:MAG: SAM-dependent methyltransferase, partial [Rhizobiales bacterium]|nr:SAM-dependent methyltransferase [Hyphomicrobiales bacterium]
MSAAGRLKTFRKLLAHLRETLGLDIGFRLWDGSLFPDDWPEDAFAVRIADEGVVAALLRSPRAETLANIWVTKRIDFDNGDIFDLLERRPDMRSREIRKRVSKLRIGATLARFLFVKRGGPWPLDDMAPDRPTDGSSEENRRNIAFHYDVSNAFYELFLDREMVYSCGYCTRWDNDLDRMQRDKLEMICRKLRLKPGETLLDIGCGWGALSLYAAENYGVTTHGVTLSEQQFEYARAKAERMGLADRCRFELADYATVEGQFDKVAAIGIQEHIGIDNYPDYYATVRRVLKPDGIFLHQAVTRPAKRDARDNRVRSRDQNLLARYVFPGTALDNIGNTLQQLEQHGFEVHDVEGWREHYQRTCRHWHDRLNANYDKAVKEGGEITTRLW